MGNNVWSTLTHKSKLSNLLRARNYVKVKFFIKVSILNDQMGSILQFDFVFWQHIYSNCFVKTATYIDILAEVHFVRL